jgi:quercetin dioxygenase-like cupin family protein
MSTETAVRHFRWDDMPKERVTDTIDRRLVTGERMMIAHVYLKKGAIVPKHQHENEQITYILEGALRFWIGEDQAQEIVVRAGEVLTIPSMVWHQALALEDTLDVDVFNPPRQDWLDKTDSYFHDKVQLPQGEE